jgi:hypothetical protein
VGDAALEQFAVAGQYDALLVRGDAGDLAVFEVVVVERIEAGHAQQMRQAAEMGVRHEADFAQRLLADT